MMSKLREKLKSVVDTISDAVSSSSNAIADIIKEKNSILIHFQESLKNR